MRHLLLLLTGILLALLLVLVWLPSVWAAFLCYDEKYYPSVNKLAPTDNGFVAYLGGRFLSQYGDTRDPRFGMPRLVYTREDGWKHGKEFICRGYWCFEQKMDQSLGKNIPPVTLSKENAIAMRAELKDAVKIEQKISARTEYGGMIWFGIGFYSGEGTSGVGGVGRYDPKTGKIEIRRPNLLQNASIHPILHDGKSLWLGTYGAYECIGNPPVLGLVRYEWDTGRIESFEGKEDGPCGYVIHDLLQQGDHLWVATDMGMSRWDSKKKQWDHYIPIMEASLPMQRTTCEALYTNLLNTLPKEPILGYDFEGYYVQLFDTLARFRPLFLKKYIKTKPVAGWACAELKFLAREATDFKTLKEEIIKERPARSPHFECLLYGYGSKGSREPEWRDLLLSITQLPGDKNFQLRNTALAFLKPFSGDEKAGKVMVRLLETAQPGKRPYGDIMQAIELLPITLGKKSVPFLIEALDRFKDDMDVLKSIGDALEKVTRYYWTPEGIQPIPANQPRRYLRITSMERFLSQWKAWWEVHKSEYINPSGDP